MAERFIGDSDSIVPHGATARKLPENDHDFKIVGEDEKLFATVQLTEIVLRDYCTSLTIDQYHGGKFANVICLGPSTYLGVDDQARKEVIRNKIAAKKAKAYAIPKHGELWLVIWTVAGDPIGSYTSGGRHVVSVPVQSARVWLATETAEPFNRVYYYSPDLRPELVWPVVPE